MGILSVEFILPAFLIFVRVTSLLLTAPFFSFQTIPTRVKAFFGMMLTVALFPVIPIQAGHLPSSPGNLEVVILTTIEALTGVVIGLAGQIVFGGIQIGGKLLSINIGLGFAQVVDPVTQNQSSVIGQMLILLGTLLFLSVDGPHMYVHILAHSFEQLPLGMASLEGASPVLIEIAVYMFIVGVQLASPFIVVLFLLDLSFAIFARIMPQANIFFIALPLKIGIGVLMLMLVIPYVPVTFGHFFSELWRYISELLAAL